MLEKGKTLKLCLSWLHLTWSSKCGCCIHTECFLWCRQVFPGDHWFPHLATFLMLALSWRLSETFPLFEIFSISHHVWWPRGHSSIGKIKLKLLFSWQVRIQSQFKFSVIVAHTGHEHENTAVINCDICWRECSWTC